MKIINKKLMVLVFLIFGIASLLVFLTTKLTTNSKSLQKTSTYAATTDFEQYCQGGVYYTQKDGRRISCGRAPNCGGWSYDATEQIEFRSKAECWVEDYFGGSRCNAYCAGNVPLCCYKLALTKNLEDCVWTERYYCHPSQCQGVGGDCGRNIQAWCVNIDHCINSVNDMPYISLENRLLGQSQPQPTNTPQPQATNTPIPQQPTLTFTPIPNQPTNSPTNTRAPIQPTSAIQPTRNPNSGATWTPVPTWTQAPAWTQTPNPQNTDYPMSAPLKSPKELAREVINPENIQKLNDTTEKPLAIAESSVTAIKSADKKLETFIEENILFQIKIFILKLFQSP